MATPRNDIVRLRLTTLEKESWGRAAGGKGKISEWVRSVCNAAAATGTAPSYLEPEETTVATPKPSTPPALQAGLELRARANGGRIGRSEECARAHHHRSGSYCGTCKRVQK